MWWLGFALHEMSWNLFSIFLPIYIISIGGSPIHVGLMSSLTLLMTIPASMFWGYICDATRRYKACIALAFLSSAVIIYVLAVVAKLELVIALYIIMSLLRAAHEPSKNVLIAELNPYEEWMKSFATYEYTTEVGVLLGFLLGFLLTSRGASADSIMLSCSCLYVVAFLLSMFLVNEPSILLERRRARIERRINSACRSLSSLLDFACNPSFRASSRLRAASGGTSAFCCGIALFYLATTTLFTPLPLILSYGLAISSDTIYLIYMANSAGCLLGYILMPRLSQGDRLPRLSRLAALRGLVVLLLLAVVSSPLLSAGLISAALFLLGLIYALFYVYVLALSMEIMPEGKAGFFNSLTGLGNASGAFLGPFMLQCFGFTYAIAASGALFISACIAFKLFERGFLAA